MHLAQQRRSLLPVPLKHVTSDNPSHLIEVLLGLHFRGRISLGTQYANGTVANPNPIRTWARISRYMLLEPGAIAAPMKEMIAGPTKSVFRA